MTATSLSPAKTLHAHEEPVRLVKFGPDALMVTADVGMQVVVWQGDVPLTRLDMRSENPRQRPHDRLRSAAFDATGETLYLAAGCRLIAVDTKSGEEVWRYHAPEFWPFMLTAPQTLAMDDWGGLVASFDNGSFERWTNDRKLVYRRKNREAPVFFTLDLDNRRIIGCEGHSLTVWNLDDGNRLERHPLEDHAFAFAYSPKTGRAAVRFPDTLMVWRPSVYDGEERIHLPPTPPLLAFGNEGTHLAYAFGPDVVVRREDLGSSQTIPAEGLRFVSLTFDEAGHLWAGRSDGSVHCWHVR